MAVTCGIFHYLALGAPCCLCLCIVLLFFPSCLLSLSPSHTHIHTHTHTHTHSLILSLVLFWVSRWRASCVLLFVVPPAVWGTGSSDWSPLHGLSSLRLWLLHRGDHPPQDQPLQPGRPTLLSMGKEGVGVCVCVCLIPISPVISVFVNSYQLPCILIPTCVSFPSFSAQHDCRTS